ncbi:GNAT family N-acetyltransferase [Aliifodinibius sp. S!AR15-10]|uniref:GNAT family N-acetyltransferase n=1 Tax=Aliifodinibius sp. S!AR15-10 TaxID=2950437 RepID=UPI00285E9EC6|nr:GNAT family N-acetyltransferase [Aliifodinibius sp. S!AR15-10]MDR8392626.1 GNAT family N-acetyltransferase [Aliifodinibius sp. S!AR15-10]
MKKDISFVFSSEYIISTHKEYREAHLLDGFIAYEDGETAGVLLFSEDGGECELVYLHSLREGKGIAKRLIKRLIEYTQDNRISRLYVVTTNDNITALKLYQQVGFRIKTVYPDAMDRVRQKKPMIPKVGNHGIPLRDLIELDFVMKK